MEINIHTLNEKVDEVVLLWKYIAAETVTQTRTQKYKEYNNKCIFTVLTQYQILNRSNSIHPCMVRIYQGLHWCILETLLLSSLKFWPADTAVSFTHRVYLVCTIHVHSLPTVIPGVLSLSRRETICSATSFLHYTNWPWVGTTWSDCLNKKKTSGLII